MDSKDSKIEKMDSGNAEDKTNILKIRNKKMLPTIKKRSALVPRI